jgi:hypothetical protein
MAEQFTRSTVQRGRDRPNLGPNTRGVDIYRPHTYKIDRVDH